MNIAVTASLILFLSTAPSFSPHDPATQTVTAAPSSGDQAGLSATPESKLISDRVALADSCTSCKRAADWQAFLAFEGCIGLGGSIEHCERAASQAACEYGVSNCSPCAFVVAACNAQ